MIPETEAMDLWYQALALPLGLAIRAKHRESMKTRLYQVRARSSNESLYSLQINFLKSKPDWLIIRFKSTHVNTKPLQEADLDSL